jgi:hypothetical protein
MRRLAVLVALGLAVAVPAAAQTEPPRLAVTATSDHCAGGLPVVDYTVTNQWPTAVSVQTWWLADASVFDVTGTHDLKRFAPSGDTLGYSIAQPWIVMLDARCETATSPVVWTREDLAAERCLACRCAAHCEAAATVEPQGRSWPAAPQIWQRTRRR